MFRINYAEFGNQAELGKTSEIFQESCADF